MRVKAVPYRVATKFAAFAPPPRGPRKTPVTIGIVAFANTEGIAQDTSQLLTAVAIALPLILLLSLGGGYLMARRALRPVAELGAAVAAIAPTELTRRLPVTEPRDEIGALAAEFNGLLGRLSDAQSQNRRFLREAAHQIRTPLTLVLGEAAHELAAKETNPERMRGSLTRIGQAAERMRRRVDELFLLAEAQAGEKVALEDEVELDELALSSADLMRPRATSLGRSLAIGTAEHVVTRGNAALLHEAVLELFENALRHGNGTRPVTVSVSRRGANAVIDVSSGGTPFSLPAQAASQGPDGLGLPIVRWVAETHDGTLSVAHHNGLNVVGITLPVRS
jgi:signal transduction histidine kinase